MNFRDSFLLIYLCVIPFYPYSDFASLHDSFHNLHTAMKLFSNLFHIKRFVTSFVQKSNQLFLNCTFMKINRDVHILLSN